MGRTITAFRHKHALVSYGVERTASTLDNACAGCGHIQCSCMEPHLQHWFARCSFLRAQIEAAEMRFAAAQQRRAASLLGWVGHFKRLG